MSATAADAAAAGPWFYTGGRAPSAGAPWLVFVHGAANDHSVWALQSRYFAHHGYNVLVPDLPGHGRSPGPALESVEAVARWLWGELDARGVESCAIVGHSMGSLIALAAAGEHPDRVDALALLGSASPMAVSDGLLEAAREDRHEAFEMINGWSHAFPHGGNVHPGVWNPGTNMRLMERSAKGVLFLDLSACRAYAGAAEAARRVRCPALLLSGERDLMTPPRAVKTLATELADRRITVLPACGHAMMSEQPDLVLDALRTFLSAPT